jgi:hypothetical protein
MAQSTQRSLITGNVIRMSFALVCLFFFSCAAESSSSPMLGPINPINDVWATNDDVLENASDTAEAFTDDTHVDNADAQSTSASIDTASPGDLIDPTNAKEQLKLAAPSAFRLSNLWISAPPLCVALGDADDCVNMEALANDAITASFALTDDPLDLIGVLTASEEDGASHLHFGESECEREDGNILNCTLPEVATDFGPLSLSKDSNCWPSKEDYKSDPAWMAKAPCFSTHEKEAHFNILGFEILVEEMQVLGSLNLNEEAVHVPTGQIIGFLSKEVTDLVVIEMEGQNMLEQISLSDLLHSKAMVMHTSGKMGWNVVLSFDAETVPLNSN